LGTFRRLSLFDIVISQSLEASHVVIVFCNEIIEPVMIHNNK
jgi:hypothetical protein